ncbi:probable basic-leucine zipper transcription factor J isoform X1 [Nilaparvata lugens]|uniref:probable basic-leucine zipper transcription factor J isoform X1 n=1 Tax=Nilaparvata lugens TaxID=108931 RepID=UPI00193D6523|nr:probable basic-leucine zipper transcription factor J isoform X1 [Nilaparvata lugens]
MIKEGISLPSHYPLTKQEERELKRIRRKIRNKISAQDSRKRKKEYVDGLEDRVKQCTEENETLMKRLKSLQSQNQTLSTQLKRLQAALLAKCNASTATTSNANAPANTATGAANTHAQPATCLMVLMLSLALVMAPNLRQQQHTMLSRDVVNVDDNASSLHGGSRSLLYTKQPSDEMPSADASAIMSDLEELIKFNTNNQLIGSGNKNQLMGGNQLIGSGDELIGGIKQLIGTNKQLIGGSSDHDYTMLSSSSSSSFLSSANRKRAPPLHYVVPPLDDDDRPPRPKRARGGDELVEGWGKSGGELSAAIGSGRGLGVEGREKSAAVGSGRGLGVEGRGKSGGDWSVAMETDGGEVAMVTPINKSRNNEVIVRIRDGAVF